MALQGFSCKRVAEHIPPKLALMASGNAYPAPLVAAAFAPVLDQVAQKFPHGLPVLAASAARTRKLDELASHLKKIKKAAKVMKAKSKVKAKAKAKGRA